MADPHLGPIDDRQLRRRSHETMVGEESEEAGEEAVTAFVLSIIAGLRLNSFTLYLVADGGHGHVPWTIPPMTSWHFLWAQYSCGMYGWRSTG